MKKFFILLVCMLIAASSCISPKATMTQKSLTLPTYGYSDPDPVAHPESSYYPYYQFEGYSATSQEKAWNVVEMENPYIKVTIMPEIGGKIWGAVEKSSGNEFIYFNHAVKFRQVAMRGPWTSGGIELNFGIIGHAPTTSSAVDYAVRENEDGSVSCFLGALEQVTGSQWCVEVKLEKDKAYFTTTTHWDNPSGLVQPYYQWMNAGYKASEDLKFFFPGTHYIGHNGDAHTWPVDEKGRHLDEYANNNFGSYKSYHVLGGYSQFYSAYWSERDFGSVHHSAFEDKLGMKIWIWGLSRQGMIWEDLLTDSDGQYVELQSGRMFNQPSEGSNVTPFRQHSMEPYTSDNWTEYWYPIKGTQGVSQANEYGALYIQKHDDTLVLSFCPTADIDQPIELFNDGYSIYRNQLKAACLQTWSDTLTTPVQSENLKVVIGNQLLVYSTSAQENELNRPIAVPSDFDWNSTYGLYIQGVQARNTLNLKRAVKYLEQSLELDPYFAPSLCTLADIHYRTAKYDEALSLSSKALSLNTYDPYANYIHGLACVKRGRPQDAKAAFAIASYSPSMKIASAIESGKLMAAEGQWSALEQWASRHLCESQQNVQLQQLLLMAYRSSGEIQKALELSESILRKLPLTQIVRFEQYLLGALSDTQYMEGITNELPDATLMWVADWYQECGAVAEAIKVLELSTSPLALYRRAFLCKADKTKAANLLKEAQKLSVEGVLPKGLLTLETMKWAASEMGGWPTDYYLGLMKWHYGDKKSALNLLNGCGNDVEFAPFYMCRAQLLEDEKALADLKRSEQIHKSWRVGRRLIEYYLAHNNPALANKCAREYIALYPESDVIGLLYAQSLSAIGEYSECVDFLLKLKVLPNEGAVGGHTIYRNACLEESSRLAAAGDKEGAAKWYEKSLLWPENLGSGKPYDE